MVILEEVADGYLLQCECCGTHLSCRHGHGVIECPKCSTMQDPRRLERLQSAPAIGTQAGYFH